MAQTNKSKGNREEMKNKILSYLEFHPHTITSLKRLLKISRIMLYRYLNSVRLKDKIYSIKIGREIFWIKRVLVNKVCSCKFIKGKHYVIDHYIAYIEGKIYNHIAIR